MKSMETTAETNPITPALRKGAEVPVRIVELIERRDKAFAEATNIQRIIDREALRLEKEAMKEEQWKATDWTTQYTGLTYRILSAIWHAPNRRLTTEKIEVWQDGAKRRKWCPTIPSRVRLLESGEN